MVRRGMHDVRDHLIQSGTHGQTHHIPVPDRVLHILSGSSADQLLLLVRILHRIHDEDLFQAIHLFQLPLHLPVPDQIQIRDRNLHDPPLSGRRKKTGNRRPREAQHGGDLLLTDILIIIQITYFGHQPDIVHNLFHPFPLLSSDYTAVHCHCQ